MIFVWNVPIFEARDNISPWSDLKLNSYQNWTSSFRSNSKLHIITVRPKNLAKFPNFPKSATFSGLMESTRMAYCPHPIPFVELKSLHYWPQRKTWEKFKRGENGKKPSTLLWRLTKWNECWAVGEARLSMKTVWSLCARWSCLDRGALLKPQSFCFQTLHWG